MTEKLMNISVYRKCYICTKVTAKSGYFLFDSINSECFVRRYVCLLHLSSNLTAKQIVYVDWTETDKYYEADDWSKTWAQEMKKI